VEQCGSTSVQVLNEFYVNATRKLAFPMSPAEAWHDVECFAAWKPVPMDMELMHGAWRIQARFGHSWWDSLIVAAAEQAGCVILYSEDLQHNQQFFGVRVCNPFL
jgi:predicted nucleic acid-binding protein